MKKKRFLLFYLVLTPLFVYSLDKQDAQTKNNDSKDKVLRIKTKFEKENITLLELQDELRVNEVSTAKILNNLHELEKIIVKKHKKIEVLKLEKLKYENILHKEKEKLFKQIHSSYQIGKNNYIRLFLNQDKPNSIDRALIYHKYYNRALTKRMNYVIESLNNNIKLNNSIVEEIKYIYTLKNEQTNKLEKFNDYRTARKSIIKKLATSVDKRGTEINSLKENKHKLGSLFQDLNYNNTSNYPSFSSLKGNLSWPVKGIFLKKFGEQKKGNKLKWDGVLINAKEGSPVKAISAGKVIFANWFRNLGLLIIIEHGNGYMSLYGHNQSLLKNIGDLVSSGEEIATIGDSGGQNKIALYFEIRKGTKPLNPKDWIKG